MPGRVASTVARPLSGDRYIPRPNLPANPVVDPLADSFPPRSRIEPRGRSEARPELPRYQANVEYWGSSEVNPDHSDPRAICCFSSLVTFALSDRNIGVDATQARQHEFLRRDFFCVSRKSFNGWEQSATLVSHGVRGECS